MASKQSPYLTPDRLGDVLAAIQAMGSNEAFRQTCEDWTRIISGPQARGDLTEDPIDDQTDDQAVDQPVTKEQTNRWKIVFDEHPEFFRRSRTSSEGKERYSLISRRALPLVHREHKTKILNRDYKQLSSLEKKDYGRPQLSDGAIETLMAIAVNMHARAVEEKRDRRWWIPPILSGTGALAGALIAALIGFVGLAIFHARI
jgi:hypothetical protein